MRKLKITAIVLCIIVLSGVLAACGSSAIPQPTVGSNVTTIDITGSCEMKVDGSTITVTGETSFISDTNISISVVAQSGLVIDSVTVVQPDSGIVEAVFQIADGDYKNVESITGFITVSPSKQHEDAVAEYGAQFEKISSATVWNKDGNVVMFSSEPYEF